MNVSTRAPREGVRHSCSLNSLIPPEFQLAHPARGCDVAVAVAALVTAGFNSRTPRGGATLPERPVMLMVDVSTRAPREGVRPFVQPSLPSASTFQLAHPARGCDGIGRCRKLPRISFNSRTPRGGATESCLLGIAGIVVSTRAPREGVRQQRPQQPTKSGTVSTRAPREGVRPLSSKNCRLCPIVSTRAPREGVRRYGC